MPPVAFCSLDDAFSSEWEQKNNKKYMNNNTFKDAEMCNKRNNEFQNGIAKNQFELPTNPLNPNGQVPSNGQVPNRGQENYPFNQARAQFPAGWNKHEHFDQKSALPVSQPIPSIIPNQQLPVVNNQPIMTQPYPTNNPTQMYQGPWRQNFDYIPGQNEVRIPQYYNAYQQYNQWLPQRWMMNQPAEHFGNSRNTYGIEHFNQTDQTNKLLLILIIILGLLLIIQLIDVIKN